MVPGTPRAQLGMKKKVDQRGARLRRRPLHRRAMLAGGEDYMLQEEEAKDVIGEESEV